MFAVTISLIKIVIAEDQFKFLTPETGCGYSNVTHRRIVGGTPAKLGSFPWMALIGYSNDLGETSFKCGGSLITKKHVLTAAHCLKSDLSSVRLGEHNLDTNDETKHIDGKSIGVIYQNIKITLFYFLITSKRNKSSNSS